MCEDTPATRCEVSVPPESQFLVAALRARFAPVSMTRDGKGCW